IPGMAELDLKLAAKASGNKKCEMLPLKQLLPTPGYIRGACSPVGMKRELPTYVDEYCKQYEVIYVSAGKRGLQIKIAPDDLVMFTKSKVCKLIHT
ncbi:MAG: YbaK/EbsC family protein, partial [Bacteroides sp.]